MPIVPETVQKMDDSCKTKSSPVVDVLCFLGVLFLAAGICGLSYHLGVTDRVVKRPYADRTNQTVYVRGDLWVIRYDDQDDLTMERNNLDGLTDCKQQAIFIVQGLPDARRRETVLHELLHAGSCRAGDVDNHYWDSKNVDVHQGVHRLGNFMSELFRENPDLTHFLAGDN